MTALSGQARSAPEGSGEGLPTAPARAAGRCNRNYWPSFSGLATSRMQSMKVCTTGLIVRSFNVTIATGQVRWEKSTGNTLSECVLGWGKTHHGARQHSNKTTGGEQ